MDWTPREAMEAAEHPDLADHPANVLGLSNAPRSIMNDLVQKHRTLVANAGLAMYNSAAGPATMIQTHGGQKQVVTRSGQVAAVHDGSSWHKSNTDGSMRKMPKWDDAAALEHGVKRHGGQ